MSQEPGVLDPSPLLRYLELSIPATPGRFEPGGGDHYYDRHGAVRPSDRQIAEYLGVTIRTIQRWRHGHLMTERDGDRIACRLGLHPALLWSSWYTED